MIPSLQKLIVACILFVLSWYSAVAQNIIDTASQNIFAFMNEELECDQYVFPLGQFPKFRWKNETLVKKEIGEVQLSVKYFNSSFEQVFIAEKPGRYGAVIEGITPVGFTIRRYVTLFCADVEFDDYSKNVPIKMNQLAGYGINNEKWDKYSNNEEHFSFGSLKFFPRNNADAAIFLAGLNDMDDLSNNFDTPRIRDRQWWINMKGKLEHHSFSPNPLKLPKKITYETSAQIGDTFASLTDYDEEKIEDLRNECKNWAEKGRAAHVVLLIHKGKIIFYEIFDANESEIPLTKETKIWMASITKLLTGVLMMQFVDQGIIDLDAPVGRYLPELNGIWGDKLLVRNLFTHTNGLHIAGEWASDWNYSLENQIAHMLPFVEVGKIFSYHRAGYALAGKIFERITGRAVPYLFQEYIFSPLGMKSAYSDNTYGGLYCTSEDLAKLGQMLLNKGVNNGQRFFSEQSYYDMLPKKLGIDNKSWGIGTSSKKGVGLSEMAFGHGAASGTLFCIDPVNDLIIISARNEPGKMYDEFEKTFIEKCTSIIKD
ncbi:MAG: beta-lactamase family protein [Ignavibacteriaceae bacterium]|nr:beta-lactamase family protein [Ignavibacteriaceae bacterium]